MGYPKATFLALSDRIKREKGLMIDLLSAGPLGAEVEEALVQAGGIGTRIGAMGSALLRDAVNRGEVRFLEGKGGQLPAQVREGRFGKVEEAFSFHRRLQERGTMKGA